MTIQEIKALPRTEEGIFDLVAVQQSAGLGNIYQAADLSRRNRAMEGEFRRFRRA